MLRFMGLQRVEHYWATELNWTGYLDAEYIMQNARLDEAQTGIKIAGWSINNLKYADDTTLMAESNEELKSILMMVKEESEKTWLKSQHSKK